MYLHVPFTRLELHLDYPSITRGRTFVDWASHRVEPDLVAPGTVLVWIGRVHAVMSHTRT